MKTKIKLDRAVAYKLFDWMRANEESLKPLTYAEIATKAAEAIGIKEISISSIADAWRDLGWGPRKNRLAKPQEHDHDACAAMAKKIEELTDRVALIESALSRVPATTESETLIAPDLF